MDFFAAQAMNFPCRGAFMDHLPESGTGHLEEVDPVAALICLTVLSLVTTKRSRLPQSKPDAGTLMSASNRPSLLSQTRTDS